MRDVHEFRQFILESYLRNIDAIDSGHEGEHVRIAIVDSILETPPNWDHSYTVDKKNNYIHSDEIDTTGHGAGVLNIISFFAAKSTYKFHRVVADDEDDFKPSSVLKALDSIRNDDVDIANLSLGMYRPNCQGDCRLCVAAREVTASGTLIAAGAGNDDPDEDREVFCPARSESTLAVGMSESICTASPPKSHPTKSTEDMSRPPGAYWIDHSGLDIDSPYLSDENYCSYARCSPFHECTNNRKMKYWEGNVSWENYLPETVAPGHYPRANPTNKREAFMAGGTSYSTAIVSGALAVILGELPLDKNPSPERIKRVIQSTSDHLACGHVGKFNAKETYSVLKQI